MTTPNACHNGAHLAHSKVGRYELVTTSSFFVEKRASALPSPADVRARNRQTDDIHAENLSRPPPVRMPSLGLLVKYGSDVTVTEAITQLMIRDRLYGRVPIPEVFGWTEDGGQIFIYMQLIEGDTLAARWHSLSEVERHATCAQLRDMVACWRSLAQDGRDCYIGSHDKKPLNDICFDGNPEFAGPFEGFDAVEQFQNTCGIDIPEQVPIVFTHADLLSPNIILSRGSNPTVVAVIDWAQAGWYPSYWEYCKSRLIGMGSISFDTEAHNRWRAEYLPLILDAVDEETCYHPWLRFALTRAC